VASTWNFYKFLQAKCSYTFVLAEDDETGKQITYTSKHKGNFDLYLKPLEKLSLGLTSRYTSKKFTKADNSEYIGSYFVVDAKADYAFEKINLFLKLTNLLDRDYEIGDGYPGEPIACTAGIKYGF
jgi:outer membrane cobalamin receptor